MQLLLSNKLFVLNQKKDISLKDKRFFSLTFHETKSTALLIIELTHLSPQTRTMLSVLVTEMSLHELL